MKHPHIEAQLSFYEETFEWEAGSMIYKVSTIEARISKSPSIPNRSRRPRAWVYAPADSPIRVGDWVVINDNGAAVSQFNVGDITKVIKKYDTVYDLEPIRGVSHKQMLHYNEFNKIIMKPKETIEVGDKVRITDQIVKDGCGIYHLCVAEWLPDGDHKVGDVFEVLDIAPSDYFGSIKQTGIKYKLFDDNQGNVWWYHEDHVELVSKKPKYKKGDYVEVIGNTTPAHGYNIGDVVLVTGVKERGYGKRVYCIHDGCYQTLCWDDVKPVERLNKEFSLGDKVLISEEGKRKLASWIYKDYGKVEGWSENNRVEVRLYFKSTGRRNNYTFEFKPEHLTKLNEPLEIGDKVEVTGNSMGYSLKIYEPYDGVPLGVVESFVTTGEEPRARVRLKYMLETGLTGYQPLSFPLTDLTKV